MSEPTPRRSVKLEWLENLPTHPDLSDGAVRTGARLAKHADRYGRGAYPGPALLAKETGKGLSTVKNHLAELASADAVVKVKVGGMKGGHAEATEYRLSEWWTRPDTQTGTNETRPDTQTGTRPDSQTNPSEYLDTKPVANPVAAARANAADHDDAAWLAAQLGAPVDACREAIARKQQQASGRGNPWRQVSRMVRGVIPLDEWRTEVDAHKPASPRRTAAQCADSEPHARHEWSDGRNAFVCMGVESW